MKKQVEFVLPFQKPTGVRRKKDGKKNEMSDTIAGGGMGWKRNRWKRPHPIERCTGSVR
ncbi:hypothetical protein ACFO8Q_07295 [Effusibacillus consociatus]|uniref:Uncharacterized protein n=1 Tax=Effusibacillus consociatus TaxID=1117041 RepID=A0ABV9PZM2_9BACL